MLDLDLALQLDQLAPRIRHGDLTEREALGELLTKIISPAMVRLDGAPGGLSRVTAHLGLLVTEQCRTQPGDEALKKREPAKAMTMP